MDMNVVIRSEYSKALSNQSDYLADEYQTLCSAEQYDKRYLEKVPAPILDADFGCGNTSKYVREGDAVFDLGSGSGKICYILSQIVGPNGKVFGVDFTRDMVALARSQQETFAGTVGFDNMRFSQASITDLRTDLEMVDRLLARGAIDSLDKLQAFEQRKAEIFTANPLISDDSIDVIVSNCVINLVRTGDKVAVFHEMFRVLKPGGRIAISDNVSNIEVPPELQADAKLWAACYAGVFQEQQFYAAIESAGFTGLRIDVRNDDPAKTVDGLVFRSVTITAVKPPRAARGTSANRELMYRGPWREVVDESGLRLRRGEVAVVSAETAARLSGEETQADIIDIDTAASAVEAACCPPARTSGSSGGEQPKAVTPAASANSCCG